MGICKFKATTSANDKSVHYVFKNKFGFIVHICRILTENKDEYGSKYAVLCKYKGRYYIETYEVYQKETWKAIASMIDNLDMFEQSKIATN